ncbi:protein YpmT [Bacillus kexueae]|uniref:protein YpmT n=1 Tax=Aeribacillus kexueae TaxID=2078952 RepID=UPI001FAF9D14|nr:protein YpmT [Bacillus kexueae]
MKKIWMAGSILSSLIAVYFLSLAYKVFAGGDLAWDLDKIYLNVSYAALCLSLTVYFLHLKDQNKEREE